VHGISSAAQARHGGPLSSHWRTLVAIQAATTNEARHTLTFLMLHESHALRNLLVFWGCCESDETSGWI